MMMRIPHDELLRLLDYNPATGVFRWKMDTQATRKDAVAGSIYQAGYRYIQIGCLDYRACRLAWFYVTGEDPSEFIDHINMVKDDDRIANLRIATNSQNQANRGLPSNNTSGVKGVRFDPSRGKWVAAITVNGVAKSLGRFSSKEAAIEARRTAAVAAWGEFARMELADGTAAQP